MRSASTAGPRSPRWRPGGGSSSSTTTTTTTATTTTNNNDTNNGTTNNATTTNTHNDNNDTTTTTTDNNNDNNDNDNEGSDYFHRSVFVLKITKSLFFSKRRRSDENSQKLHTKRFVNSTAAWRRAAGDAPVASFQAPVAVKQIK